MKLTTLTTRGAYRPPKNNNRGHERECAPRYGSLSYTGAQLLKENPTQTKFTLSTTSAVQEQRQKVDKPLLETLDLNVFVRNKCRST